MKPFIRKKKVIILSKVVQVVVIGLGKGKGKGKAVPLQAWSGPKDSRKLKFPDFMTMAKDGGKVVSLIHRPTLPPMKFSWYSFPLEAESIPGP
jgi:hypothetical protein